MALQSSKLLQPALSGLQQAANIFSAPSDAADPTVAGAEASRDGAGVSAGGPEPAGGAPLPASASPAGTDKTVILAEDGSYIFAPADFGFSDPDGHAFAAVRISTVPAAGKLFLDPDGAGPQPAVQITSPRLVSAFDLTNGRLSFVPNPDGNGAPYSSFTFQVQDSNNELDSSPNLLALNVTPINDAPYFQAFEVTVTRVPTNAAGAPFLMNPAFSPDGTQILFETSFQLVAGDTNPYFDIYIKDLSTGSFTRISTSSAGGQGNGESTSAVFSPDGTLVAFTSKADNLVAGDTNGVTDVFVKDLATGAITRVSTYPDGHEGTSLSVGPLAFSPDGTRLLFASAEEFSTGIDDPYIHLFVKDLSTGAVTRVTSNAAGEPALFGGGEGAFSPSGTKVAFASVAENLIPGVTGRQIYLKDLLTGSVTLVSARSDGTPGNIGSGSGGGSDGPIFFSPDGTKIVFSSSWVNLVDGDTNGRPDIFIKDLATGIIVRASTDSAGNQIDDAIIEGGSLSPDGTEMLLTIGGVPYIKNLVTGELTSLASLVSPAQWTQSGGVLGPMSFSADGDSIVFQSAARITPDDTNTGFDIYTVSLIRPVPYGPGDPPIQVAPIVTVTDVDSNNYSGGSLGVAITAGAAAGDQLGLASSSTPGSGVEVSGANVTYNGVLVGTLTASATSLSIAFNANAGDAAVEAVAEAVRISSTAPTPPDGDRTVTFTLVDGGGTAGGGHDSTSFTRTVAFDSVDDPAVAHDDAFTIDESSPISGNLFSNNGSGSDSDPDGPPLHIMAVNGSPDMVGGRIVLDSGALLTVGADGFFNYDPNGAFDQIPLFTTGASNTPASDSFTYTLDGGATATVTIIISGLDSDDTIRGTPGADYLVSDGGVDTLVGLGGDDVLIVKADDIVIEEAGGGLDNVAARTSHILNAGAEVEVLSTSNHGGTASINLFGNEFGQTVIGNAGSNYLDGGGGTDRLQGLGGDDTMIVDSDDIVIEAVGGGLDNVAARTSYTLNAGAEVEVLSTTDHGGTANINLVGNAFGQTIIGNAGSNYLVGGGGADRLQGLGGDDTMIVDADDIVIEAVGGGLDNVAAQTSYVLNAGAEVEVLSTINHGGTSAINLFGNAFGQTVIGNAGSNYLDGGGGIDRLQGLGGDDVMIVDIDDIVIEAVGGGLDNVASRTSYALNAGAEVEVLSTTDHGGTLAINLTGNAFGQTVIGNAGNNILDGGAGIDRLQGLGGADIFSFSSALGAGNIDTIIDMVSGVDRIALDDSVFAGLTPGALPAGAFVTGTQAQDADDRIIYNPATGALLFDADGVGGAAAVQFAILQGAPAIAAGDFFVS